MKSLKKELIIGLCVVVALLVLFFGIDFLKGINVFKAANYYYGTYTNVAGLQKSAPVTLNGFKVGQVREIDYDFTNPGHVRVELSVDKALRIPKGSEAVIEQDILGTATVVLHLSDASDYEEVGSTIASRTATGMLDNISGSLMPSISAIFPKVDSLLTNLNRLVGDSSVSQSVKRLDAITGNLEATMKQIRTTAGALPPVMQNINSLTGNLNTMSSDLAQVAGNLKEAPIDSMIQNLNVLSANLKELSGTLNNPESSLGLITHDSTLYDNLNNCAASLDSLLIDVKKNPKRYISIKLL
ncbi:MAG: MCE family protein [Bacteroidales bacterium]|nr:MCE family protein [Bacteroidales bacterium]